MRDDLDEVAFLALLRSVSEEITRIVGEHIPWAPGHEFNDRAEMEFIMFRHAFRLDTWDPKKSEKAWEKVCLKARELQGLWNDIDSNAQFHLRGLVSVAPFDNRRSKFKVTSRYDMSYFLNFGGDILGEIEEEGRQMLGAGRRIGRRNIRAVAVVDGCRTVWERRTGRAPSISMRAFGDFLAEIFAALEPLGLQASPEAAYKSWAEFVES